MSFESKGVEEEGKKRNQVHVAKNPLIRVEVGIGCTTRRTFPRR